MKIAVVGTGYVGLPTGVGFASAGHDVACIDSDAEKIASLAAGRPAIFERGLSDMLARAIASGRIRFTTSVADGLKGAQIVIVAVGTSDPETGATDLSRLESAMAGIAPLLEKSAVVAVKSTAPAGTSRMLGETMRKSAPSADFALVSMPEFLREGFAIGDFMNPDRIVVGTDSARAKELVRELYRPLEREGKILFVSRESAEVVKYASNAFLAMKISFINEIADFCAAVGADVREVAKGVGLDSRIGESFLNPGPGFGGSCLPKDLHALVESAGKSGVRMPLLEATLEANIARSKKIAGMIAAAMDGIREPGLAILGLAFKAGTDDVRQSPSVGIIQELPREIRISAYDPQAMINAEKILGDRLEYAPSPYAAADGADALAVLTEWEEFARLDLARLKSIMRRPRIIDARGIIDCREAERNGFAYTGI